MVTAVERPLHHSLYAIVVIRQLLYVAVITGLNVITPRKCVELLYVYLLSP